jgi:hypothetical protein
MKHLSTFLTEFRTGFQKASRYTCQLFVPEGLLRSILNPSLVGTLIDIIAPTVGQQLDQNFSMPVVQNWLSRGLLVEEARTPSRSSELTEWTLYGITERVPVHTEYTSFDCMFRMPLVGTDCPVPRFFNYWQNFIQAQQRGPDDGLDFRFPGDYYGTMLLSLYDNQTHPTITYKMERVYPKTIESSQVGWEQNNTYLRQHVSFGYSYWTIVPFQPPPLIEIDIEL